MNYDKPFKRKYDEEHSPKRKRDRFELEFNEDERQMFLDAQRIVQQHKDTTAAKQLLFMGALAISRHDKFMTYFRDTLLKNERNNKRLGVVVESELDDKIRNQNQEMGRKLR